MDSYDLVVIGGGSGGLTSAIMGARVGARVLLVDRERLGGDCLHFGCVPSKALIASARMAHRMRHAADYGIRPVDVSVDFPAVMERIRRIQAEIGAGESPEALSRHGVEVAFGGARFLDEHAIQIGADLRVSAKHAVIATGSPPSSRWVSATISVRSMWAAAVRSRRPARPYKGRSLRSPRTARHWSAWVVRQ